MLIHEIDSKTKQKSKKRVGRGGKRGTYSGRGQKGQRSRAGRKIMPALHEQLIQTPKLRGYKNKPKSQKPIAVSLSVINKLNENEITNNVLIKNGILSKKEMFAKILSNGSIEKPKIIKNILVSKTAKEKIEKVGGKVI